MINLELIEEEELVLTGVLDNEIKAVRIYMSKLPDYSLAERSRCAIVLRYLRGIRAKLTPGITNHG